MVLTLLSIFRNSSGNTPSTTTDNTSGQPMSGGEGASHTNNVNNLNNFYFHLIFQSMIKLLIFITPEEDKVGLNPLFHHSPATSEMLNEILEEPNQLDEVGGSGLASMSIPSCDAKVNDGKSNKERIDDIIEDSRRVYYYASSKTPFASSSSTATNTNSNTTAAAKPGTTPAEVNVSPPPAPPTTTSAPTKELKIDYLLWKILKLFFSLSILENNYNNYQSNLLYEEMISTIIYIFYLFHIPLNSPLFMKLAYFIQKTIYKNIQLRDLLANQSSHNSGALPHPSSAAGAVGGRGGSSSSSRAINASGFETFSLEKVILSFLVNTIYTNKHLRPSLSSKILEQQYNVLPKDDIRYSMRRDLHIYSILSIYNNHLSNPLPRPTSNSRGGRGEGGDNTFHYLSELLLPLDTYMKEYSEDYQRSITQNIYYMEEVVYFLFVYLEFYPAKYSTTSGVVISQPTKAASGAADELLEATNFDLHGYLSNIYRIQLVIAYLARSNMTAFYNLYQSPLADSKKHFKIIRTKV
jgi:hypothetical protein